VFSNVPDIEPGLLEKMSFLNELIDNLTADIKFDGGIEHATGTGKEPNIAIERNGRGIHVFLESGHKGAFSSNLQTLATVIYNETYKPVDIFEFCETLSDDPEILNDRPLDSPVCT
jgi:hypothetical protein